MCEVDNVVRIATAVVKETLVFTELTYSTLLSCKKLQTLAVREHQSIFVNFQDFFLPDGANITSKYYVCCICKFHSVCLRNPPA